MRKNCAPQFPPPRRKALIDHKRRGPPTVIQVWQTTLGECNTKFRVFFSSLYEGYFFCWLECRGGGKLRSAIFPQFSAISAIFAQFWPKSQIPQFLAQIPQFLAQFFRFWKNLAQFLAQFSKIRRRRGASFWRAQFWSGGQKIRKFKKFSKCETKNIFAILTICRAQK